MTLLNTFIDDFKSITNDVDLSNFLDDYALTRIETEKSSELARHEGSIDGNHILIIHTWYNPDGPFSMEPEMNELELLVNGSSKLTIKFSD